MVGGAMAYRTTEQMLGEIVRLREERGVSQAQLGEVLDVDQSTVSKLESGERGLAASELGLIADFLGTTVEGLVRAEEDAVVFRGDQDVPAVRRALEQADELIDNFLYLRALVR